MKIMGQKKINNSDVQKLKLKQTLKSLVECAICILTFEKTLIDDPEQKKKIQKFINNGKKTKEIIDGIRHIEILISLFNTFITGKEQYFVISTLTILKDVKKFDSTEKGFKEFLKLEQESRAKFEKEQQEKKELQEKIAKAREEGKKVEMTYVNGKVTPIIVEEKPN